VLHPPPQVPGGAASHMKAGSEQQAPNLGGIFAMSSLPYMSKLESITSSAVRAAEKVGGKEKKDEIKRLRRR